MLKFLFAIFFLIPIRGGAFTLSQVKSTPSYFAIQEFSFSGETVSFKKGSNFFDEKIDYELGTYEAPMSPELKKYREKLLEVLSKLTEVDKFLRDQKSSFNDLNRTSGHESYIVLEKFKIPQNSRLYVELKDIFDQLRSQDWRALKRVRVSDDMKRISEMGGKETLFNIREKCSSPRAPSFCFIKGYGVLFLEPLVKKDLK